MSNTKTLQCDECKRDIPYARVQRVGVGVGVCDVGALWELLNAYGGLVGRIRISTMPVGGLVWCVACYLWEPVPTAPSPAPVSPASLTHAQALASPCTHSYPCPRHLAEQDRDRPPTRPVVTYRTPVGVVGDDEGAWWEVPFTITGRLLVKAPCGIEALRLANEHSPSEAALDGLELDLDYDTPERSERAAKAEAAEEEKTP